MCLVAGAWGDCSADLHNLVQTCAESRVEHLCRSTGGVAERDSEPAPEIVELVHSSSTSSMSLVQGGRDLPTGKGGREEARGGSKGGEGAQGGAEGSVDGNFAGAGLGEERQMPYRVVKKDLSVLQSRCLSSL